MKIIRNNLIPFKGYKAINLFGILFVREGCSMSAEDLNHEAIHTAQVREMLWLPFYVWYLVEWLIRLALCVDSRKAYRSIGFEKEAYANEHDLEYLGKRKHFAWLSI